MFGISSKHEHVSRDINDCPVKMFFSLCFVICLCRLLGLQACLQRGPACANQLPHNRADFAHFHANVVLGKEVGLNADIIKLRRAPSPCDVLKIRRDFHSGERWVVFGRPLKGRRDLGRQLECRGAAGWGADSELIYPGSAHFAFALCWQAFRNMEAKQTLEL